MAGYYLPNQAYVQLQPSKQSYFYYKGQYTLVIPPNTSGVRSIQMYILPFMWEMRRNGYPQVLSFTWKLRRLPLLQHQR